MRVLVIGNVQDLTPAEFYNAMQYKFSGTCSGLVVHHSTRDADTSHLKPYSDEELELDLDRSVAHLDEYGSREILWKVLQSCDVVLYVYFESSWGNDEELLTSSWAEGIRERGVKVEVISTKKARSLK